MSTGHQSDAPLRAGGPHYYTLDPDSDVGGEVYERRLLERLPAHGVDVVLGLPRDHRVDRVPPGWTIDILRHRLGLHWVRAPLVFTPYAIGLLRAGKVDVLRGHSVRHTGPSLLLAKRIARSRVPVVLHHHHLGPRWRAFDVAVARRADAVITVSSHSRQDLVSRGVRPERVHVIPDGVDRPPVTGGWPDAWPRDGLRLLHLGRLEARKRPGVALETLGILRGRGVEASLVIAGDGPLRDSLVAQAQAGGIADAVRFVGRVSDQDKWRLYDSAQLLLFASTLEGFGLVVAEAQSRGVPVIAAEGTATAEALDPGRTGFLTAPSGAAFAERAVELADAERRAEMSAAAHRFAERFDWDNSAAGVAGVYRRLLER